MGDFIRNAEYQAAVEAKAVERALRAPFPSPFALPATQQALDRRDPSMLLMPAFALGVAVDVMLISRMLGH